MKVGSLCCGSLSLAIMLGMGVASCFGTSTAVFTDPTGSGGTGSTPDAGNVEETSTGELDASEDEGGPSGMGGSANVEDAPAAMPDSPIDRTTPEDTAMQDANDGGDRPDAPTGRVTLFSFDSESEVAVCDPAAVMPPCWESLAGAGAGAPVGDIRSVNEEAVVNHDPRGALEWTASYPDFDTDIRLVTTFATNQNWTGRSRVHLSVKVTNGLPSLQSYELYVQGGMEAQYGSIYRQGSLDSITPVVGAEDQFRELVIDFTEPGTDTSVLVGVSGLGFVFHSVTDLPGGRPEPPPTVIVVDDIWLE